MSTPVTVVPGTLPAGYCYPSDPQQFNYDILSRLRVFLDENFPGVYVGATAPPPDQRDRAWLNTNDLRWYYFFNGNWWTRATSEPGPNGLRIIWNDTPANLWSFEGGDGTDPASAAPTLFTGAMWQVDSDFTGRIPMGAGLIPDDPATTNLAQGAIYGSGGHELLQAELPDVNFQSVANQTTETANKIWGNDPTGSSQGLVYPSANHGLATENTAEAPIETLIKSGGQGDVIPMTPPVRGVYIAKRTVRAWKKI